MEAVLLDTDVVLDIFFDRKPFSEYATQVLGLCETAQLKGYVTPVICSNVYYILRQTARHDKVIEKLGQLLTLVDVLAMDKDVVLNALNSDFNDFEDSLQHFAAKKAGRISLILTRNLKEYKKSDIAVLTPEAFMKAFS
jgi:predicted nucleic acid-binding protein